MWWVDNVEGINWGESVEWPCHRGALRTVLLQKHQSISKCSASPGVPARGLGIGWKV